MVFSAAIFRKETMDFLVFTKLMLEVGMAVFANTSAKSIETRQRLYDKANHTEVAWILRNIPTSA